MATYGVTKDGFIIKPFDAILAESLDRAKAMFGKNVDLTDTSPLLQILRVSVAENAELWKCMEDLYYSNFISTAIGDNLDLLGEDLNLPRRYLFACGQIHITIKKPAPGRSYVLPEGAVLVTAAPVKAFFTTEPVTLSENAPQATVTAQAFERGSDGNIAAAAITGISSEYQKVYLTSFDPDLLTVTNPAAFSGGLKTESDEEYRARLIGLPRNIWTLETMRRAVLDVNGVIDVLPFDPLGGVDASQSYFNLFRFGQRAFSGERRLGEPYFFDLVVAHEFAWPWRTQGVVQGIYEKVTDAVEKVRPVGIHPNIIQADHIEVGVQARVIVEPGYDSLSLLASIKTRIARDIGALKLGGDVLYSQVMRAFVEQPGVIDVQNLRLRRCPAAFGRIIFGGVFFQSEVVESLPGENLVMDATEIAIFLLDSELIDIEVVA